MGNDDSQLPLDIPVSLVADAQKTPDLPTENDPAPVRIYSFTDKKAEKDKSEATKHFSSILKLVRHFR